MISMPRNIDCGHFDGSEFLGLKETPDRKVVRFEIEFYLNDAEYTYCDGTEYRIKKDHIQIAHPGQLRHSLLPFTTYFLKFDANGVIADRLMKAPLYFKASHTEKIKRLFNEIILLCEKCSENDLGFCAKVLETIDIILLDSELVSLNGTTAFEAAEKAKHYIELNFSEPIGLSDIAAAANLSTTYFHSVFSSLYGKTPHAYLLECRVENAKKMLWSSENDLCDIAVACGFGCQQYFTKVFRRETGLTPGQYRKRASEKYLA